MIRSLSVAAAFVACSLSVASPAPAQQQAQGQQSAIGAAQVRTREGAPSLQLTNQQTPLITVAFGPQQQQSDLQITALVTNPEQPQQDKEIVFNRAAAQHRIVAFEGQATGSQNQRLILSAQRGQDNAVLEPIAQNEAVQVFGVRKAEPKVAQQPQQQPQQPQQGAQPDQAQQAAAQQAAAQQAAAQQTPEQQAAAQKAAAEEAKRKAAEPKPDKYDAIVTVFLTTGR